MSGDLAHGIVSMPAHVETLARAVALHPDYAVGRRLVPLPVRELRPVPDGTLSICVVDVVLTGLDDRVDRIVELAMRTIGVDGAGVVVAAGDRRSWLEDPRRDIPARVTARTGLTNADVACRSISDAEAYARISLADAVLSRDARTQRPFVDARLDLRGQPWICGGSGLEWERHGVQGGALTHLLRQVGWFSDGRRAGDGVEGLIRLLEHRLPTGRTVAKELLLAAERPAMRIQVPQLEVGARFVLLARGYRWDHRSQMWLRDVSEIDFAQEVEWFETLGVVEPGVWHAQSLDWRTRHAGDGDR